MSQECDVFPLRKKDPCISEEGGKKASHSWLVQQNRIHLWLYSCIALASILSDLTIDPPLLNLQGNKRKWLLPNWL